MSVSTSSSQIDDDRLVRAVHEYLESLERGPRVDRHQFVEQHAEIADALEGCLDAIDIVEGCLPHFAPSNNGDPPHDELDVDDRWAQRLPQLQLGDYRILRRIGQGGMGVVYEARQLSLERHVALKILPFAAMLDPRSLKRFHTEAVAAASLDHPHIVGIHSVGCERGIHYYAMQLIPGRSLAEVIRDRQTSLTDDDNRSPRATDTQPFASLSTQHDDPRERHSHAVARLGLQAAEALEFAHQMGVVHRDIKPSNLLIDPQAKLWVTDFGLAMIRSNSSVTMTGELVGTLRYMSPEQAGGQRRVLDHRTDVYSLGMTLYETLVRRPAFATDDRRILIRQILENNPVALRKLEPTISRDLETIVHKAIEKQPDRRYQSAQEMADDLRRFLEKRPILARRTRWPHRCWSWARRNRSVSALLLFAASLVLFLAIAGPVALRRETVLRREAERQNYVLAVNTAYQAFEQGNLTRARNLLVQQQDADRRGFEWHHLSSLLDFIDAEPTLDHGSPVTDIALSSDERMLATAGADGTIKLWDLRVGRQQLLHVLNVDAKAVHCLAFFPDGKTLIAGGSTSVTLWQVSDGTRKRELPTEGIVFDVAVSPSGDYAAWTSWDKAEPSTLSVWRVGSSDVYHHDAHAGHIRSVAFSPDGALLATAGQDCTARLWSVYKTDASARLEEERVFVHRNQLYAVAFSPDGNYLAAGGYNYETRLWDLKTGELAKSLRSVGHSVTSIAFGADGDTLITGGRDNCASVWDLETGRRHQVVRSHTLDVTSVARSRDGALLVTGSNDGTARLWPISPLEQEDEQGAYNTPIGFVPGTRQMVVGCDSWGPLARDFDCGGVRVFDLMAGQVLSMGRPDEAVTTLAVAPANNILVPGGGLVATSGRRRGESTHKVHLWNSQTGQLLKAIDVPGNRLAFSPDGGQLAITTGDERLLIWDLATSTARWDLDVGQSFSSLAYTPDGRELWLGFRKSLVSNKLWRGGDIQRRSAATGELLQTLRGHDDFVWSIAFSPDGNRVATASLDKTIRVWDRDKETSRLTLSGHTMFVLSVAFSPDGRTLASGSGDGTVRLWDPQTGDELATLRCQSGVDSVAFSDDGKTLAAGHTDQSVSVWHAEVGRQSWPRSFR